MLLRTFSEAFPYALEIPSENKIGIHIVGSMQPIVASEEEIRALLNYCELPFNSKCLHFNETDRPVSTASHSEVRQPIYTSSVSGWLRYEKQMQPFINALG